MSLLFIGAWLIGLLAIAVAFYYLAVRGWSTYYSRLSLQISPRPLVERIPDPNILLPYSYSTFKFKKAVEPAEEPTFGDCCVCLTGFEDGEEVRQLPHCKHSYHGACIDMWLYSHSDCPLCRSPINRHLSDIQVSIHN